MAAAPSPVADDTGKVEITTLFPVFRIYDLYVPPSERGEPLQREVAEMLQARSRELTPRQVGALVGLALDALQGDVDRVRTTGVLSAGLPEQLKDYVAFAILPIRCCPDPSGALAAWGGRLQSVVQGVSDILQSYDPTGTTRADILRCYDAFLEQAGAALPQVAGLPGGFRTT